MKKNFTFLYFSLSKHFFSIGFMGLVTSSMLFFSFFSLAILFKESFKDVPINIIVFLIGCIGYSFSYLWHIFTHIIPGCIEIVIDENEIKYRTFAFQKFKVQKIENIQNIQIYQCPIFSFFITFSPYKELNTTIEVRFKNNKKILIFPFCNYYYDNWPGSILIKLFKKEFFEKEKKNAYEIMDIFQKLRDKISKDKNN